MKYSKYITTPIYYVNDVPHIGHAFTTVCADFLSRYYKSKEYDVYFLTGSDEHGKKIEESAEKQKIEPKEFVDNIVPKYIKHWKDLEIDYNRFIRTTDKDHEEFVQNTFNTFLKNGDLYKGEYKGLYCVSCEQYYDDNEIVDKKCPIHKRDLELISEETYFFKLSKYQNQIKEIVENGLIKPDKYKQEILMRIDKGLKDVSVSRKNVKWGIKMPFDTEHTVYVWYDALLNYASAMPNDKVQPTHLIGKEIMWFHSVYWIAILLALKRKIPQIYVHGWWTANGEKMSKSLGNIISIEKLTKYDVDIARFFLLRQMPYGEDSDFNLEMFKERYDEYLNNVSNLVYRVSKIIESNSLIADGKIDDNIRVAIESCDKDVSNFIQEFRVADAIKRIIEYSKELNKYMNDKAPWSSIKSDANKAKDDLTSLVHGIEYLAIVTSSITPRYSSNIRAVFSLKEKTIPEFLKEKNIKYGGVYPKMILTKVERFEF